MDPKQSMTAEEVKQFFSATDEYQLKEAGENIKISYTSDNKTTSLLVWNDPQTLTVQQLIRTIQQLKWNHCHEIFD